MYQCNRLLMDFKQMHTRLTNIRAELSRDFPGPSDQMKMLLGVLEHAGNCLQEAKSIAENGLIEDSSAQKASIATDDLVHAGPPIIKGRWLLDL